MPGQKLSAISGDEYVLNPRAQWTVANRGGQNTGGCIQQGVLAMSNVDLTQEMTDMIAAQRMFDLNAAAAQMTNWMMGDANQNPWVDMPHGRRRSVQKKTGCRNYIRKFCLGMLFIKRRYCQTPPMGILGCHATNVRYIMGMD